MDTLISLAAGVLAGAAAGGLVGFLYSYLRWWGMDCRDLVLRRRGHPLPKDRVFRLYHWHFLVAGGVLGAWPAVALGEPPLWAAALAAGQMLGGLAACLLVFLLQALYAVAALCRPSQGQLDAELLARAREALVGRDSAEAAGVAQKNGWDYETLELESGAVRKGPTQQAPSRLLMSIRVGKVAQVSLRSRWR
jgi:hypothetical protein